MKRLIYYPMFLLLLFLSGCIQENEALVYPPLIVETVQVRYFNLHNDEVPRTLLMDRKTLGNNIPFNVVSRPDFPPYDSATLQVMKNDNITYRSHQKFKFARQSNYVMIALPDYRIRPDSVIQYEDTIVYLQTTILSPDDSSQCFVKFLNCNPDSSVNYSIKLGCPNGENLFIDNEIFNVSYLQGTGIQAVYEGIRVISVIKNNKNTDSNSSGNVVVGIFELDLKRQGQYALVINKNDELFFIDELDANSSFIKLDNVEARNAYVRVVNLSSANVSVNSSSQGDITSNLNSDFVDNYKDITTCDAMSLDRITLLANGTATDTIFMSFDIYKKYSMFAFDTDDMAGGKIIGVPPIDDRMRHRPNQAIVRTINGNITENGITVSIGARDADNDLGYESGTTLAVNLLDGEYSDAMYINAGAIPISVFATTQPTKYMFSSLIHLESGKEYIIAVDGLNGGNITAIELDDEVMPIQYGPVGSFLQFVNVCNGNNVLNFTLPNLISNGKLSSSNLLTTFLTVGNNSIQTAGNTFEFNTTKDIRTLLIATSNPTSPVLFAIQSPNMGANNNRFRFRFINASDDVPVLRVDEIIRIEENDNRQKDTIVNTLSNNIAYQTASNINSHSMDRKYSFRFINQESGELIKNRNDAFHANDLLMTLNKNYSIIFYGNKNVGYKIFIVQEY